MKRNFPGKSSALRDDRFRPKTWAETFILAICALILFLAAATSGFAGETLTVSPTSISFGDADPDTTPYVAANTTVSIFIKLTGKPPSWQFTHRASTNLQSGGNTIPISNITWTTNNPSFAGGTMSTVADQLIASGSGNYSSPTGLAFTYSFHNLWTHPPGNYTATTTFTLSAP